MILQELNYYYERKAAEPDATIPSYGSSLENISFALVLNEAGELLEIEDLRESVGKKLRPRKMVVPAAEKKASGIKANFLWDSTNYVLGLDDKGNPERTAKCHEAFICQLREHCSQVDTGLKAVLAFLDRDCTALAQRADWPDICGANLVFRLSGVKGYIHEREAARKSWERCLGNREAAAIGQCLITGDTGQPLARLHPSIKGVRGAQSSGGSIVSFNKDAFESYGKEQSINAPVSQKAAFNYATALNTLLSAGSRQKVVIGDTSIVFWAECKNLVEDFFADLIAPQSDTSNKAATEDDQQTTSKIHSALEAMRAGKRVVDFLPELDESVRFFVLGLAPNAARLSIRFWEANTVGTFLDRIGLHFRQLAIVRQFENEPEFPPLWRLLCQTATLGKSENISPVLAGGMTRAMLSGRPYPQSLLSVVLGRIRTEQEVGYFRASLLKAFLVRNKQMEVSMSLDLNRKDMPYLLGRLFAVLEKAQNDAISGASATIRDRFFSSAPATPARIFPMLLKNAANHTAKLRKDPDKKGWAFNLEKMIQDIVDELRDFPSTLLAEEQGLFMIGYYQQMKDFYTKKTEEK